METGDPAGGVAITASIRGSVLVGSGSKNVQPAKVCGVNSSAEDEPSVKLFDDAGISVPPVASNSSVVPTGGAFTTLLPRMSTKASAQNAPPSEVMEFGVSSTCMPADVVINN